MSFLKFLVYVAFWVFGWNDRRKAKAYNRKLSISEKLETLAISLVNQAWHVRYASGTASLNLSADNLEYIAKALQDHAESLK